MQLTVKGSGTGAVDAALAEVGLSRRIVVSVPHFWIAPDFLEGTDLLLTMPKRLFERIAKGRPELKGFAPPLPVKGFTVCALWHERVHRDPGHQWLREQLVESTGLK